MKTRHAHRIRAGITNARVVIGMAKRQQAAYLVYSWSPYDPVWIPSKPLDARAYYRTVSTWYWKDRSKR